MINPDRPISICSHLAPDSVEYNVWFTGSGLDRHWVCADCASKHPTMPTSLVDASDELIEQLQSDACWEGICGKPEVKQRMPLLTFAHEEVSLSKSLTSDWIDIQPNLKSDNEWFVLLASGDLATICPVCDDLEVLFRVAELGFEIDAETGFCVSHKQDYAAVYQTSGRLACVVDLQVGAITARVDRGDYHPENSHFPIAFFTHDGRSLLVAATDWNRLDIIDPADGKLLTDRSPTSYGHGEEKPEHYLDYFHAQLSVSPDCQWIVDNGWVWHPWGIVRSWNVHEWLTQNSWESEDGPTVRDVAGRAYYWDGPLCWADDSSFAVWGWGEDEEWLLPAVRMIDVDSGDQTYWFPGPNTRRPSVWPPKKLAPSLFFDQFLFAVHDEDGTTVWDIKTGEQLGHDPSLKPIHYHPRSKEFLSLLGSGIRLSRLTSV